MSVSVTCRIVMLVQGVAAVHLNWAMVVELPGRMLCWLLLPRTRSNEMLVKRVLLGPSGVWQGKGQ